MATLAERPLIAPDDRIAKRNALVLAVAQALAGANQAVVLATGGIVGAVLAPDRGLATVPITMMVMGLWLGTLPIGWLAGRYGRRFALVSGTVLGILAGLIACLAVLYGSFLLFCFGAFVAGLYAAGHQSYRFAATDAASDSFRPKAIAWVLAGGIFASLLGPQLVITTQGLWQPFMFAATFIGQSVFAALAGLVLMLFKETSPRALTAAEAAVPPRPLKEVAATPRFAVAVLCGVAAYAMMNLVMTSAPLAMIDCGFSVTDATLGLQWHMIGMFAPSLFTGSLIARFGVERIVFAGLALLLAGAATGLAGITLAHFWIGLILLGVGWNFAFIGATAMVAQTHRANERTRVQAFNDFLVFGSVALASFLSGKLLASAGWEWVNGVVFPPVLLAAAILAWLVLRERRRPGAV